MKRRINLNSVGFAALGRTLIKNNRAQRPNKERDISLFSNGEKWADHKTASPELLAEIRERVIREQSKRRRRVLVTTLIITAIIIGGLIYVMNY